MINKDLPPGEKYTDRLAFRCLLSYIFIDQPVFVPSTRGNRVIQCGPHRFREHSDNKRQQGPKKRWICNKSSIGCRAYIITLDDHVIKQNIVHNH